jgi:ATP-dependent Clp protease adapter protein ClpS
MAGPWTPDEPHRPGQTPGTDPEAVAVLDHHPGWKVLLFNDDVTPFDRVVFALQKAANMSEEVAEMVANEAHLHGEAVVKRGLTQEDAVLICALLRSYTRDSHSPGVLCDAVPDTPA